MNIENFINDFKNYCETVEDTRLLNKIKNTLFNEILNLCDIARRTSEYRFGKSLNKLTNDDTLELAKIILVDLQKAYEEASLINDIDVREIWKVVSKLDEFGIEELFNISCEGLHEMIVRELYPNYIGDAYDIELSDDKIPSWTKDLITILRKHGL